MTMTKTMLKVCATLALLLPAPLAAQQDPMPIAQGAQVYSDYCASCHNARASSERTDLEWIAIVLHMRARANFTKSEASDVLAFLQATNLPETMTGVAQLDENDRPVQWNVVFPFEFPEQLFVKAVASGEGRVVNRPGGESR